MMKTDSTNFCELKRIARSTLEPFFVIDVGDQISNFENAICLRCQRGVGIQFLIDWRDPFVYTLIWSPLELACPVGYTAPDGREIKMYLQTALGKLGVSFTEFNAKMLKMRGDSTMFCMMMKLSVHFLASNLELININCDLLFSQQEKNISLPRQ